MKKAKNQVFIINGGMTFKNRKDYLKFLKTRDISCVDRKSKLTS